MNYVRAVRTLALDSVVNPDGMYKLRRIVRWFSTNFHTPIDKVEGMDIEYVLRHYFEDRFQSMKDDMESGHDPAGDFMRELNEMTETDEERRLRMRTEKSKKDEEDDFVKQSTEEEREEAKQRALRNEKARKEEEAISSRLDAPAPPTVKNLKVPKETEIRFPVEWSELDSVG